ncbi:MAG: substrate-binding domain-containing protein, partial [Kiritimatiellia bacterium]|nr:substrate-binding domain-containing protein [Kiritimatiellia bacterium]
DEAIGIDALVEHLLALGHRRMAFLGTNSPANRRRGELLQKILAARGSPATLQIFHLHIEPTEAGHAGFQEVLKGPAETRPTAILAATDSMAHGALRCAATLGIRVPKEVSISGIDDIPSARLAIPSITTIRQPMQAIAQAAFDCLMGKRPAGTGEILIRPDLFIRESTGPVPQSTLKQARR